MWTFLLGASLIILTFIGTGYYVAGSGITSAVKVTAGDCGKKYNAEIMFNGDWFCPEEKSDD